MDCEKVLQFINDLADDKTAVEFAKLEKSQLEKQKAMESLTGKLDKEKIRDGLTFTITDSKGKKIHSFDKRGQEYAIDTFAATKDGKGIDATQKDKIQKAMEMVVTFTHEALAMKTSDGQLMFDPASETFEKEVIDEVFTPLVREGILPDNLVQDRFSEVHRLIQNAITGYKKTLGETQKGKLEKDAEIESGLAGSRGLKGKAKAVGGKLGQLKERLVEKIGKEKLDRISIAKDLMMIARSAAKVKKEIHGWVPDEDGQVKNLFKAELLLKPELILELSDEEGIDKFGEEGWKYLQTSFGTINDPEQMDDTWGEKNYTTAGWKSIKKFLAEGSPSYTDEQANIVFGEKGWEAIKSFENNASDPDYQRAIIENAKHQKRVWKVIDLLGNKEDPTLKSLGTFLANPSDKVASDKFYTKSSYELLKTGIDAGRKIKGPAEALKKYEKEIQKIYRQQSVGEVASKAMAAIDKTLVEQIQKVHADAGDAFSGLFLKKAKGKEISILLEPEIKGSEVIEKIASAVETSFASISPLGIQVGMAIGKGIRSEVKDSDFVKAYEENPDRSFQVVIAGIQRACGGLHKELKELFSDRETIKRMAVSSIYPDDTSEANAVEEIRQAEDEIDAFERSLVLIDEGGLSAAQQRSIEALIAEIEKDRKVLELVNTIGSALQGAGGTSMGIAGWATREVTDTLVAEVMGPVKAAKLIMEFAVSVKKASERWALWKTFQQDLEHSKIAVSALTSTIQGFYNNKKEQCAFRTIEQALMIVQIAAEILGSIPTPITMAIGKTMTKVNGLVQKSVKFAEKRYDIAMMKKAWRTTREAIDDPGNRPLGLKALRLNPSLGMHAIAWAATELKPPDPIARMILDSVGLNENTMAVSGTEEKVRMYLVTLLNEDRDLTDPSKFKFTAEFKTDWAPDLSLDLKCWTTLTTRASRIANPKLALGDREKKVFDAFKAIAKHPPLETIEKTDGPSASIEPYQNEIKLLIDALKDYAPVSSGNVSHEEMEEFATTLLDMAYQYRERLNKTRIVRQEREAMLRELTGMNDYLELILEFEDDVFLDEFDSGMIPPILKKYRPLVGESKDFREFESNADACLKRQEELQASASQ